MTTQRDVRRHRRHPFNEQVEILWSTPNGHKGTVRVRGLDISEGGLRVASDGPFDQRLIYVCADRCGVKRTARVVRCSRDRTKYVYAFEFASEAEEADLKPAEPFVDYYELLEISPRAEQETIHRVFRMLAARYHPDNQKTGDPERFLLLTRAYEVLSDPETRVAYDGSYQSRKPEPLPVFELREFLEPLDGEVNRRMGLLCLLYARRRMDPGVPGLSLLEFETAMSFPREHLEFTVWYLRQKGYVRQEQGSDYAITAAGVDFVESRLPSNRLFHRLLRPGNEQPMPGTA